MCLFWMEVIVSSPSYLPPMPLSPHPRTSSSHVEVQSQSLSPSFSQLVEEQLWASKEEEGVQAPLSHGAPQLDSSPSESVASQDVHRCDHGPHLGLSDKASPPETDFKDCQSHGLADAHLSKPKAFAVFSGRQECPPLWAQCPLFAPQGPRCTYSALGPRAASIPRGPLLLRRLAGQWAGPVRIRRTCPACPSSGPLPTACCPLRSLWILSLPRALPALEVRDPRELPSASIRRESVTSLPQGVGGSGTAASMGQWGVCPAARPQGAQPRCDPAVPWRSHRWLLLIPGLILAVPLTWVAGREGRTITVGVGLG